MGSSIRTPDGKICFADVFFAIFRVLFTRKEIAFSHVCLAQINPRATKDGFTQTGANKLASNTVGYTRLSFEFASIDTQRDYHNGLLNKT